MMDWQERCETMASSIAKLKKLEKEEICIMYRFMPLIFEDEAMSTIKSTIMISYIF
jgi:hypothetical protein